MDKLNSIKYFYLFFVILCFLNLTSCKKTDSTPIINNFTWTSNGTNYKANVDSAFLSNAFGDPIILAGTGSSMTTLGIGAHITLISLSPGSYLFGTGTNSLIYFDEMTIARHALSGSLNIIYNQNNYLSGNFSVVLNNSNTLSGNFSNVPISK